MTKKDSALSKSQPESTIWQGVVRAARGRGINLISFIARDLDTTVEFDAQANVFYDPIFDNCW